MELNLNQGLHTISWSVKYYDTTLKFVEDQQCIAYSSVHYYVCMHCVYVFVRLDQLATTAVQYIWR